MPNETVPDVELTTTQKSIIEQLTENTGRHLLDSGDAYGRNWERNQGRDFLAEKEAVLNVKHGYVDITLNLFPWLAERVDYDVPEVDEAFVAWSNAERGAVETYRYDSTVTVPRADLPWLQNAEEFVKLIGASGVYGDGDPWVVNTYNSEDLLSQTIQYVYFTLQDDVLLVKDENEDGLDLTVATEKPCPAGCTDGWSADGSVCKGCNGDGTVVEGDLTIPAGEYVLLQVHGGADVRGGYTRPRLYTTSLEDGPSISDNARCSLYCTGEGAKQVETEGQASLLGDTPHEPQHSWDSDNAGYSFYGNNSEPDLGEIVFVDTREEAEDKWTHGTTIAVTEDNTLHCPLCFGRLEVGAY